MNALNFDKAFSWLNFSLRSMFLVKVLYWQRYAPKLQCTKEEVIKITKLSLFIPNSMKRNYRVKVYNRYNNLRLGVGTNKLIQNNVCIQKMRSE